MLGDNMLVLIGASASGKTEIAKLLIKNYGYEKLVTTTTRPIRTKEIDGIDYNFVSKQEFLRQKENNSFFETVIYNNNHYGTPKKNKLNNVLIVEPNGANTIYKNSIGNTFILLECSKEVRRDRMLSRGDSLQDVENRLVNDSDCFNKDKFIHLDHIINTEDKTLKDLAKLISELHSKSS